MTGQIFGWAVNEPVEHAAEVGRADRAELAVEHVREVALLEGEDLAGVADHVGVGLRRAHVDRDRRIEDVEGGIGDERRLHVPVAVPLGLAVAQADAVDHAVAEERVVARARERVGAVADVAAVELGRDRPGDRQVGDRALLGDRSPVAPQVDRRAVVDRRHVRTPKGAPTGTTAS